MMRGKTTSVVALTMYWGFFCLVAYNITTVERFAQSLDQYEDGLLLDKGLHRRSRGLRYSVQRVSDVFNVLSRPSGYCRRLVELGRAECTAGDGIKQICLDERFRPPENGCLVYSFGIGDELFFEVDFARFRPDCEMHLFDPTVKEEDVGKQIELSDRVVFHPWGILNENIVFHKMKNESGMIVDKLLTLQAILNTLGHVDRPFYYFKMDVESSEWLVLRQLLDDPSKLLSKVQQFALEVHFDHFIKNNPEEKWVSALQENLELLRRLETETGLRRVSFRINRSRQCYIYIPQEKMNVSLCGELFYTRI